jgi:hypothetical protein
MRARRQGGKDILGGLDGYGRATAGESVDTPRSSNASTATT